MYPCDCFVHQYPAYKAGHKTQPGFCSKINNWIKLEDYKTDSPVWLINSQARLDPQGPVLETKKMHKGKGMTPAHVTHVDPTLAPTKVEFPGYACLLQVEVGYSHSEPGSEVDSHPHLSS